MTEATMYYPYGTMEAFLKPPTDDKAREKFTGKELDSGDNPVSEVSFNIAINNFDAGMHYHGELYVNYTDLVYNRSFLKVYPLQYDADADKFILNTADRFPDSMRVTNLRIATSGAVSPINYDKACDYTVITDSGLAITLDTSGSALVNSSGVNYFTDSTYTPERVAGSNLYYFGARYYDAELGVWGSTDRAGQYFNSYAYPNNPVLTVDPNGNFALAAAIVSAVISSAIANVKVIIEGYNNHWSAAEFGWNFCWQTNVYGNIGFISGLAGGEIGTAVSGYVGVTSGSGLSGAIAGGAAGGAIGGAAGYTGNYAADVAFKEQNWNTQEYFTGLGVSTGIGAVGGAAGGALSYGLNPNGINSDIIEWGYEHGRYQGTLDFIANEYDIAGKFTYQEFPGDARIPLTARGYTPSSSESYIYKEAFRINGNFDASSAIQTMSHEGFHQSTFVPNTTGSRIIRHVNEFYAYQHNLLSATQHGLSSTVRDYTYNQFMFHALRTPIEYMLFLR